MPDSPSSPAPSPPSESNPIATADDNGQNPQNVAPSFKTALGVFGTTFGAIFLAEFGDKTQLAVLLMTAESQHPWIVFTGAAISLIATSLVGVLLGRFLAGRLSEDVLEKVVGVIFLVVAGSLLWDVFYGA